MIFYPHTFPRLGRQWPIYNVTSPQATGLVAWWPTFGGGNVLYDYVMQNNVPFHASWFRENSELGPAVNLANAGVDTGVTYNDSKYTYSVWFRWAGSTGSDYVFFEGTANGRNIGIKTSGNTLFVFNHNDLSVAGIDLNVWYHVAHTHDGTTNNLYLNGFLRSSKVLTPVSGGDFVVGGYGSSAAFAFNGSIVDLRVYNRALSASEVHQLYAPQTRWELYQPVQQQILTRPPGPPPTGNPWYSYAQQ